MKIPITLFLAFASLACLLKAGEPTPTPAKAEDFSLFPVPDLKSPILERDRLLGTLGGPRETLAEHGVQIDFNLIQTFQGVMSGGDNQAWSQRVTDSVENGLQNLLSKGLANAAASDTILGHVLTRPLPQRGDVTLAQVLQGRIDRLDLGTAPPNRLRDYDYQGNWRFELKLDTAKMGLWPGGFFFMRVEQNFGESIDARSGLVLPPNINATLPLPDYHGVSIPHLNFTQFLSPHLAVTFGKLDPTGGDLNEFAHISGDERFVGSAFGANAALAALAPYSPLGFGLLILPTKNLVISLSAIDGEGVSTRSGFDTVASGKTSYVVEGRYTTQFGGKLGHQLLGVGVGVGQYGEFDQPLRAFIPTSGISLRRSDTSWAVYYNFDQYLWNAPGNPAEGFGLFGRVGIADPATNPIAQFYSLGIGGRGVGPARPRDRWGAGWYYMKTSDDLPDFLHLGSETGFEGFYDFAVTPACLITLDLQVTDSAKEGAGTAVIGGLRATTRF